MDNDPARMPPSTAELKAMLDRYFFGPFDERRVDELRAEIARQMADTPLWRGIASAFGGRVGLGLAWREDLAYGRSFPRAIDTAAWIVWNCHVKPRNYCPTAFVGEWKQLTPVVGDTPARWSLSADGELLTTDPGLRKRTTWCFHREDEHNPLNGSIRAEGKIVSREILSNCRVTDHDLTFWTIGGISKTDYHLRRVPEAR